MSFSNKVVVVTGASSGIGAAIAIEYSKAGANVVIVARNEIKLKNVAEQCQKVGKTPLIVKADIGNEDAPKEIIEKTIAKFSKLDILINNAGIYRDGRLSDGSAIAVYDEVMNTNLRGVVNLTTHAVPYLKETKGNIINISSIASKLVFVNENSSGMIYSMSKAGLDHFTRASACELAEFGVRVNSVNPGPVRTDIWENTPNAQLEWDSMVGFTLLKRISEPKEIADLVLFLSDESKSKGITGSIMMHDNGSLLKR